MAELFLDGDNLSDQPIQLTQRLKLLGLSDLYSELMEQKMPFMEVIH
jgi:hypothetical protein